MCTVTFIPFKDQVFITSNRDESPGRNARQLSSVHTSEAIVHFPLDEESGGSWIALSDKGRTVCLLNGAFETFIPKLSYRISRGNVVVDAALAGNIEAWLQDYDLYDVAPFTLLIFEKEIFIQLVWDGDKKHTTNLSVAAPQIWSSVTLYSSEIRERRKSLFEKWLSEQSSFDRESIIAFHMLSHDDPHNDFVMNRNDIVRTLSITSVEIAPAKANLVHFDLGHTMSEEVMVKYG